jgi:aldehyde dehydrogenase (NAD+)
MQGCHFIGNQWCPPADGQTMPVVDPSDGQAFSTIARGGAGDVERAVAAARAAIGDTFDGPWGKLTALERGRLLMKLCVAVREHHGELAQIEARDTGKALRATTRRSWRATSSTTPGRATSCTVRRFPTRRATPS